MGQRTMAPTDTDIEILTAAVHEVGQALNRVAESGGAESQDVLDALADKAGIDPALLVAASVELGQINWEGHDSAGLLIAFTIGARYGRQKGVVRIR